MNVAEWRNRRRNRKCKFCRHRGLIPTSVYFWCHAKEKLVDAEDCSPFCKLFDAREEST